MDKTLEEGLQIAILRSLVLNFDLYSDLYDIRSRRSGSDIYVEVFLGFDPESTVAECMKNIEILRCAMRKEIGDAQIIIVPATAQTPQYADSAVGQGEPGSSREPAATMEHWS
ncbi:hypothetical protein [uncultured Lamprocystis sp.]|jgi:divalent metal cation (Fe/Co/Zn/Cd) transporter|uniref:cation transporter dimerization domain-containing protein n=1 Tax=uncultured Lamprocystis sp. TaxID=543132 RepID=UPI0025F337F7|nr:hypothetical protein [uncultured Lamprocystis sp.]